MYNGKELNSDFGLDWSDYGARYYAAAIGRWNSVDPLAEVIPNHSPYAYTFNNPISFRDPTGMMGEDVNGEDETLEGIISNAWENTPENGSATFDSGGSCECGCEGKPPCPEKGWGEWLFTKVFIGYARLLRDANYVMGTGDPSDSMYEQHDAIMKSAAMGGIFFPKGIKGQSLKKIKKSKPKGWKKTPTRNNEGFIFLDEKGTERLRYMRPKGNNPMGGDIKHSRQNNGYFRMKNKDGEYLDKNGKVVPDTDPQFQEKTHIMYEGPQN